MGNSNSQHHQVISPQWAHSYPRPRPIPPHIKVLPERVPPLRLRTTDNGAILQNGGTISGRKQSSGEEVRVYRPRSSSAHRPPKPEEITLDKNRFGSEPDLRFHSRDAREQQYNDNAIRQRISRSRKKYKAPPAPQNGSGMDSSSPDLNGWDSHHGDFASPSRKVRLFKTRAETNRRNLGNSKKLENGESDLSRSTEALNVPRPKLREEVRSQSTSGEKDKNDKSEIKILKRSASQEVISSRKNLSTPEFQAELLEAAHRIRPRSALLNQRESPVGAASNSPKVNGKPRAENEIRRPRNSEESKENIFRSNNKQNYNKNRENEERNGNKCRSESSDRIRSKTDKTQSAQIEIKKSEKIERDVPSKTFYFGMEENNNEVKNVNNFSSTNNVGKTNAEHRVTAVEKSKNLMNMYKSQTDRNQDWDDSMEKFAATFHKSPISMPNGNTTSCSSSFVSDPDEDVDGGIALQLRPTLPKKQLEIPRFSPTAAWRLLSSIESFCPPAPSPADSDDSPVMMEDRIHAPLSQQAIRSSHDKSGDSGISGDASPGGCHESSSEIAVTSAKALANQNPKSLLMAWTPQQDLEEESSSDDLESPLHSSKNATSNIPGAKFSTRGQLFSTRDQAFSMSLPRDERLTLYPENNENKVRGNVVDNSNRFNSLKKLKAALGNSKREENPLPPDNNWVLSRSVPSSLTNGHVVATRSISSPSSPEQDDDYCQQPSSLKYPSYSYLATGGRMMYLPEYHARLSPDSRNKSSSNMRNGLLSKSCENISTTEMRQIGRTPSPVVSQNNEENRFHTEGNRSHQKKKKFTFQSTVRLIENRRLAERLSREAELKENQRLSELEAMKKVEEEFQKKRAREKANIRHQLRLFSLEEKDYSSLPPPEWGDDRDEPDGAPSSLPPSSAPLHQTHGSRKSSASRKSSGLGDGNKFAPTTQVLSEFREPMRDYRDYRHGRHHDNQEQTTENNRKSVVEHPRVVYDMPKNTPVYVSAHLGSTAQNQFSDNDNRGGISTPRSSSSDNYRKDFAHGALPVGGRSLASSDSEISQPHTRPTSRQGVASHRFNGVQRSRSASPASLRNSSISPPRSRSTSPVRIIINQRSRSCSPSNRIVIGITGSSNSASSEHVSIVACSSPSSDDRNVSNTPTTNGEHSSLESNLMMDDKPNEQDFGVTTTDSLPRVGLTSLQPFRKSGKAYRPICFNPLNNKLAQTVN